MAGWVLWGNGDGFSGHKLGQGDNEKSWAKSEPRDHACGVYPDGVRDFAIDDTDVYWAVGYSEFNCGPGERQGVSEAIFRQPIEGGPAHAIYSTNGAIDRLEADSQFLYWVEGGLVVAPK
ncbi:MAG: hypothetical protein QM765_26765 [Myxococcales bacterium]